jgi:alanine racemase
VVVLIGLLGVEDDQADELAGLADTISWDIFASLQARIPRIFHRQGTVARIVRSL